VKKYIPSAITSLNLIAGFTAIMIGDFFWSSILLLASFVFDSLDGLVARLLKVQSEFGKQLDSIADVVSFGVAPAYLYSLLSPDPENNLYTITAISFIVVCGAIRLAKFNISPSLPYFMGLPIPASALFYIGVAIAIEKGSTTFNHFFDDKVNYFITPVILSLLMVSFNLKMFTTKGITKDWRENIFQYITVVVAILLVILFKYEAISYFVIAYVILSIINTLTAKKAEKSKI